MVCFSLVEKKIKNCTDFTNYVFFKNFKHISIKSKLIELWLFENIPHFQCRKGFCGVIVGGGSRLHKSELTPIDYLGLVQMAMTSPQMGLISSEVEKTPPYGARQN